ncbi:hypothetical protein ACW2QC_10985 [Virgibacillus sp. FSP13]
MQNKHPIITYAYHFMSEAIILFFICLPFMNYYYQWVPYGLYLALVFGICFLFSVYTRFMNNYLPYILTAPGLIAIFIVCGFPIGLSIVFPAVLTWRYINIRGETILERENTYIRITLVLGTGFMLLLNDYQIIVYTFLQFLMMVVGYISSHLTVITKEESRFDKKLWLLILSVFAAGTVIIFSLFDTGRFVFIKIGEGLSYVAAIVASKSAFLFQFLDFDKVELPDDSSPMGQQQEQLNQMEQGDASYLEKVLPFIYWGIALIIAAFVILLVVRNLKKQFLVQHQTGVTEAVAYGDLDDDRQKGQSFMNKLFGGYFNKPHHPIRKMVYQFEENAVKNGYGRNASETVEDWFKRVGIDADLAVYQRVRYGEKRVSEKDVAELKVQLKEMEANFSSHD